MKFNPFAENKAPSRSMFAKESPKHIQAQAKAVEELEEKYAVEEYLGKEMDRETHAFFKELAAEIGEEDTALIVKDRDTRFNAAGGLVKLHCSYNGDIISLPKLPKGLTALNCNETKITSLPELPEGLEELDCSYTQITSLPRLPAGLRVLNCNDGPLASPPELPAGLAEFRFYKTPLSKDSDAIAIMRAKNPGSGFFFTS